MHPAAADGVRLRVPVRAAGAGAHGGGQRGAAAVAQPGAAARRLQDRRHVAGPAGHRGQRHQPDRGVVRRRGAAGRGRPGTRTGPEGDLRRRADRVAGLADRHEGDGPAHRAGPRGRHNRGARHARRTGGGVCRPRGDGARRPGLARPGRRRRTGLRGEGGEVVLRLGLRLTLRSGREAAARLVITAAAVAAGVALLLGVLAEFHAFQANASQPCWSCTTGAPVASALPASGDLWNVSADFYQGQTITRLNVAPLGSNAPVPPGISRLPAPGTYDASPALERLLRTVPPGQLGARFPGTLAGPIGDAALNGANDLVIYVSYTPRELATVPGTRWVTSISTGRAPEVFTPFFRYAFGVGVLAVLFPMLVLISSATQLAADRREERFAALRLVGGSPADIRVIASVESVVSAFLGAVGGVVIFLLVRPALAGAALI